MHGKGETKYLDESKNMCMNEETKVNNVKKCHEKHFAVESVQAGLPKKNKKYSNLMCVYAIYLTISKSLTTVVTQFRGYQKNTWARK